MSTIKVTRYADSLEDIAVQFDEQERYNRSCGDNSNTHITLRERRYYIGVADAYRQAASFLRETKLGESP